MATKKKKALTKKQVEKKLEKLDGWKLNTKGTQITKTFAFKNFVTALAFVAKVAVHAEVMQHHPDIELSYGSVKIKLTTHDVGGLSDADFALAVRIDEMEVKEA